MTESSSNDPPILMAENLSMTYLDGNVQALADVSLSICRGEYLAVNGPSGCGKSTLLNLLGGLGFPSSGRVYFKGTELTRLPSLDDYRRNHLGFVFQSFHLMPTLSAIENVQIPMFYGTLPVRQRKEKARQLLELVGLGHRLRHMPQQLSVGERQRVAIARSLANDPEILLGDEPTGNLDSRTAQDILDLFDRLWTDQRLTLLLVTHSDSLTRRAQRVVKLEDGRLVSDTISVSFPKTKEYRDGKPTLPL
jgi:putative ABC transport system ATP-binding protein